MRFEAGRIEFRLAEGGRKTLATDLARAIEAWTGQRWVVTLAREEGASTLDQQSRAADASRRESAAAHPLVREVMARFPGAQIVDVRDLAPEGPATAEAEILGEADAAEAEGADDEA